MDTIAIFGIGGVVTTVIVMVGLFVFVVQKVRNS